MVSAGDERARGTSPRARGRTGQITMGCGRLLQRLVGRRVVGAGRDRCSLASTLKQVAVPTALNWSVSRLLPDRFFLVVAAGVAEEVRIVFEPFASSLLRKSLEMTALGFIRPIRL